MDWPFGWHSWSGSSPLPDLPEPESCTRSPTDSTRRPCASWTSLTAPFPHQLPGVGATQREGGSDPLKAVGWITLIAGVSNFVQAFYLMASRPKPLENAAVLISGLVIFYAGFFTFLGITEILGLDLRPLGNLSAAVALVPLFYWKVFEGDGCSVRSWWCGPWRS